MEIWAAILTIIGGGVISLISGIWALIKHSKNKQLILESKIQQDLDKERQIRISNIERDIEILRQNFDAMPVKLENLVKHSIDPISFELKDALRKFELYKESSVISTKETIRDFVDRSKETVKIEIQSKYEILNKDLTSLDYWIKDIRSEIKELRAKRK